MAKKVKERFRLKGDRSVRKMANELHVSRTLLWTFVKLQPYKKQQVHELTDAQKAPYLERWWWVIINNIFFPGEKILLLMQETYRSTGFILFRWKIFYKKN
jgi:hypothetical protein